MILRVCIWGWRIHKSPHLNHSCLLKYQSNPYSWSLLVKGVKMCCLVKYEHISLETKKDSRFSNNWKFLRPLGYSEDIWVECKWFLIVETNALFFQVCSSLDSWYCMFEYLSLENHAMNETSFSDNQNALLYMCQVPKA